MKNQGNNIKSIEQIIEEILNKQFTQPPNKTDILIKNTGVYLSRDGKIHFINEFSTTSVWSAFSKSGKSWRLDGSSSAQYNTAFEPRNPTYDREDDLVKYLSEEEYPEHYI